MSDDIPFGAKLGLAATALRISADGRGGEITFTVGGESVRIRVYTAGGAEPDPWVEAHVGSMSFKAGGYEPVGPWVSGMATPPTDDELTAAGHVRVDAMPTEPGVLRGVWFTSEVAVVLFDAGVARVSAGMADIVTPAAPKAVFWRAPT